MPLYENFSTDPGSNNKAPPLGAPEGNFPQKAISDTLRVLMASDAELGAIAQNGGVDASETVAGHVERATQAEVLTGTDTTRYVSPATLAGLTATEARRGLVELATTGEAIAGTDTNRAVTPAGALAVANSVAQAVAIPAASTTVAGKVELATAAEASAGTSATLALTPNSFSSIGQSSDPGYQKFPGGRMLAFGVSTTNSSGVASILYAVGYTNFAAPVCTVTNSFHRNIVLTASNNAGFSVLVTDAAGTAAGVSTFAWQAMGY